jgi:hypothetical protein
VVAGVGGRTVVVVLAVVVAGCWGRTVLVVLAVVVAGCWGRTVLVVLAVVVAGCWGRTRLLVIGCWRGIELDRRLGPTISELAEKARSAAQKMACILTI